MIEFEQQHMPATIVFIASFWRIINFNFRLHHTERGKKRSINSARVCVTCEGRIGLQNVGRNGAS